VASESEISVSGAIFFNSVVESHTQQVQVRSVVVANFIHERGPFTDQREALNRPREGRYSEAVERRETRLASN
jgi:hypothetical protein